GSSCGAGPWRARIAPRGWGGAQPNRGAAAESSEKGRRESRRAGRILELVAPIVRIPDTRALPPLCLDRAEPAGPLRPARAGRVTREEAEPFDARHDARCRSAELRERLDACGLGGFTAHLHRCEVDEEEREAVAALADEQVRALQVRVRDAARMER